MQKHILVYWKEGVGRKIEIEPTLYEVKKGENCYVMQNTLTALGFKCNLYLIEFDEEKNEAK